MEQIRQRRVLQDVLLQVLAEKDSGLGIRDACDLIDSSYRSPEDWYRQLPLASGYDVLNGFGFDDWRTVPQELLIRLVATEPQWQNEIRWARNDLRKAGLLDSSAPRGQWRLTAEGMSAAARVDQSDLTEPERLILSSGRDSAPDPERPTVAAVARTDLLNKLNIYTHSMPLEDLEMLVEIAWAVRKRSVPLEISAA